MPRKPKRKAPASPAARGTSPEPYPSHASPSPAQCLAVRDALLGFHGFPEEFAPFRRLRLGGRSPEDCSSDSPPPPSPTVLDGIVTTLLSQNTTEAISRRAFASLKAAFPSWDQVVDEEGTRLEDAIRCGGLAATKAARIRAMLRGVRERRGKICLEYLRELSVDEVKRELSQFKGIGPKTGWCVPWVKQKTLLWICCKGGLVACVLMFYLQKDDFPVDTHVHRITKAMGWVPVTASREKAYIHLNNKIPDDLKFDLNCLIVTHGKLCQTCAKKMGGEKSKVPNAACPLASYYCVGEKLQQ
ncbi:hypothetical protein GQ55_4G283700 [Panicum hallii var. hallii]|uniref:HhH-GPD domain-containing protein n=1 Tax=Panicum hallii var. hallii TaxID=1504633 RepID=A0A2T7E121_9POAL|nr:hypothetical protein GQ55_4G283700 [Panicum hallii var. hallii]